MWLADVRTVGLFSRTDIFATIYAKDNFLHVALPPQQFKWQGLTLHGDARGSQP